MKKMLIFALCLLILGSTRNFAQSDVGLTVLEDPGTVNRTDSIIRLNIYLKNDFNVGSLGFNVWTTASANTTKTIIIPARPVQNDNATDTTKWTMDTTQLSDSLSRFLLIGSEPINYYASADMPRKVMEFFLKIDAIPFYGTITVKFTDIVIKGLDSSANPVTVTLPDIITVIDLGEPPPPPPDTTADSVFLKITPIVNRINNEAKLVVAYRATTEIDELGFVLIVPNELSEPIITLQLPGESTFTLGDKLFDVDYYYVKITAPNNQPFPAQDNFFDLATIQFNVKPTASGVKEAWLLEAFATRAGDSLALAAVWPFTIDLGEPPVALEADIEAEFSLDRAKLTAWLDFYTAGFGFDTLSVKVKLPDSVNIAAVQSNLNDNYELTPLGDGSLLLKLILDRPLEASPNSKKFLRLQLDFAASVVNQQTILFANWQGSKGEYPILIQAPDQLVVDFGKSAPPPLTVVYFLQQPTNWLNSLQEIRQTGYGVFTLNWAMNNVVETTGSINFEVPLPEYMSLTAEPLDLYGHRDLSKNIEVNGLVQTDNSWIYSGVYSCENIEKPLLPNPISKNPSTIMALKNRFDDLPDEMMIFNVNNITASGLDGRIINETKLMNLAIDFEPLYNQFILGDIDRQWGDGKLTQADVNTIKKIINRSIKPTRYQRKFSDLNKDGVIDSYDVTMLQEWIRVSGVEDDANVAWKIKDNSIQWTGEQQVELEIYNYLGQLVIKKSGHYFNLSHLPAGLYFFMLNNKVEKIYIQ